MFKQGQKVVFVGFETCDYGITPPEIGSIFTISNSIEFEGNPYVYWEVHECLIAFKQKTLRPLDYDFVEEVIAQVSPKPVEA